MPTAHWAIGLMVTIACFAHSARAEVFKIEGTGVQSCGDFDRSKFNAKNNIDTWVSLVSPDEWLLSLTPLFLEGSTFPVIGRTHLISPKQAVFTGAQFFESGFIAVEATLTIGKDGFISKAKGTFIQDSVFYAGCMTSGKFKSTERLDP